MLCDLRELGCSMNSSVQSTITLRPVGSIFRLGGLFSGHENLGRVLICNDHNMQCLQQLGVHGEEPPEAHGISLSLRS